MQSSEIRHTTVTVTPGQGLDDTLCILSAASAGYDNLISVDELSATDAARRFSDLLDAVEHRGKSFTIARKGKVVAVISPAWPRSGKDLKRFLRKHPPDGAWAQETKEMREVLFVEERSWHG